MNPIKRPYEGGGEIVSKSEDLALITTDASKYEVLSVR